MRTEEIRDQRSEIRGRTQNVRRRTTDDGQRTAYPLRDAAFFQSKIENRKSKNSVLGQAIVEFMAGLVVMLVLMMGLIQIGKLSHAHTRTMNSARAAAGLLAMANERPVSETALLISDWVPGADLRRYTHDDAALVTSNAATLPGELVDRAHLERVSDAPINALSILKTSPNPAGDFYLVKGKASESVPILPVIGRLVYGRPSLDVESDAWLVWTKGID